MSAYAERSGLTPEQVFRARWYYNYDGLSLGEVADRLRVSLYRLSPWLYMERLKYDMPERFR